MLTIPKNSLLWTSQTTVPQASNWSSSLSADRAQLSKIQALLQSDSFESGDDDSDGQIDTDGLVVPNQNGRTINPPTVSDSSVNMQYFGGKILTNPDVTNMYIGDYYNSGAGAQMASQNDSAVQSIVTDPGFTSVWHQYGVDSGTEEQSQKLGGSYSSGQVITDADIQQMLQSAITSGKITPGSQSVYNFVLPPGAVLQMSDGTSSTQGLGGYHSSITVNGQQVYYSAICASQGSNGIDFTNGDVAQNVSITESHEISEAATDPDVGLASSTNDWTKLGWMDAQNGEIGDIEVNDAAAGTPLSSMFSTLSDGTDVQKIWSQEDGTNEDAAQNPGPVEALPTPAQPPAGS